MIRNLFENALKTNESLKFSVLTGCLRVAKESIFTGLNNFKVYAITDVNFDEYFGFTDAEVRDMLHAYELDDHYETVKEWYDGYRFGRVDVYCPWDVINYCDSHISDPDLPPKNYWANTSGNEVIWHFIESVKEEKKLTKMELVEQLFTAYMKKTISVRDTFVRRPTKENFYHGILLGILSFKAGWPVSSNREAADGYSDIMISIYDSDVGIIIEVKYAENGDLERECKKAIDQIQTKRYEEAFLDADVRKILKYGIACNRKQCRVILAED